MIVLDTNIVSEIAKQRPDVNVINWLRGTRRGDLILCAPVLAELVFGAEKFRLRTADSRYFESIERL